MRSLARSPASARRLVSGLGVVAVTLVAMPRCGAAAEPNAPQFARAITTTKVKQTCFLDTLDVSGTVVPSEDVLVRPDREGLQISQISVEEGDKVASGQTLARLKPSDAARGASDVEVQAPVAGVVYASSALIGASASQQGEPLFRITRGGDVELRGETPVLSMARIKPGQPANVEIIGVGAVHGKVQRIAGVVNAMTQLGQVSVALDANPLLKIGVFGKASIELARRCGPALPLSAVLFGDGGPIAQVVRNNHVETRALVVGQIKDGQVELRQGVSEDETVVARAGAFVRDGDRVLPTAASIAASP